MKIKLVYYIDSEVNPNISDLLYKTDEFDIEVIERSDKGLLVYVADSRINDSFWVDPSEIIYSNEEVKAGYIYDIESNMTHKERLHWLKTREYREHK